MIHNAIIMSWPRRQDDIAERKTGKIETKNGNEKHNNERTTIMLRYDADVDDDISKKLIVQMKILLLKRFGGGRIGK